MKHTTAVRLVRRLTPMLVVPVLATALIVTGPGVPSAVAFDVLPSPVSAPGSVFGSAKMTTAQFNTALSGNPTRVPTSPTTVGPGASKAGMIGASGAVAGSFMLGQQLGYGALDFFGVPTSGNFVCDFATLVADSDCGIGAAEGYVPNSDVFLSPNPGWSTNFNPWQYVFGIFSTQRVGIDVVNGIETARFAGDFTRYPGWGSGGQGVSSVGFRCSNAAGTALGPNNSANWTGTDNGVLRAAGPYSATTSCSAAFPKVWDLYDASGGAILWRSTFNPARPPEQSADPMRWWQSTWKCSEGGVGTKKSEPFFESDGEWPSFPGAQCDAGAVTSIKIEKLTDMSSTTEVVYEWTAPNEVFEWARDIVARGAQSDTLNLSRVVGNERVSCFSDPSLCVDWWLDPLKSQNFECSHGTRIFEIAECNVYRPTFDPSKTVQGIEYANPVTGELPAPTTPNPAPSPGSQPDSSACFPRGWSAFNPAQWVLQPVSCALSWAFVPTNSTAKITAVRTAVGQSTIGLWSGAVSGMFDVQIPEGGCLGPGFKWDLARLDIHPFSACEEPVKTWAGWTRTILTGSCVIFGSMASLRAIGAGIGWKPSAGGDS